MIAVTLKQAETIAVVGATALVVAAIASFWIMKTLLQKLLVAVLLFALAFAVWTQREALQDCASKVQADFATSSVGAIDTECSFFGVTITISDPRKQ